MQNPPDPDRPRVGHPVRDLVISLAVLLVPLLIFFAISRGLGSADPVVVDPATAQSRAAAAFPVATPHGLSGDWKTVNATFQTESDGKVLRIGYVTPGGGALQLIESNAPVDALLIRELGDNTRPAGPVTVSGSVWRSYDVRAGERALARTDQGRTVIVIGRASAAELLELASAVS